MEEKKEQNKLSEKEWIELLRKLEEKERKTFCFIWVGRNKELKYQVEYESEEWFKSTVLGAPLPKLQPNEQLVVFPIQKKIASWMAFNYVACTTKKNYDLLDTDLEKFDVRLVREIGYGEGGFPSVRALLSKETGLPIENILEESGDEKRVYENMGFITD